MEGAEQKACEHVLHSCTCAWAFWRPLMRNAGRASTESRPRACCSKVISRTAPSCKPIMQHHVYNSSHQHATYIDFPPQTVKHRVASYLSYTVPDETAARRSLHEHSPSSDCILGEAQPSARASGHVKGSQLRASAPFSRVLGSPSPTFARESSRAFALWACQRTPQSWWDR